MSGTAPRRDNGLEAASYQRLVDVETHLVDGLLERLRDEDVAAYSAPTLGRPGHYGETVPPLGPSDSVFVDSDRLHRARDTVDRYLAEIADEVAWAGIVADFDREPADAVPRWPVSEDVEPGAAAGRAAGTEAPGTGPDAGPFAAYDERARERERRHDAEDHFEPPPPPPLPTVDTVTRFAWAGALGGPAVLVLAALAGLPLAGWVGGLAVGAFMAGFVTLVARMQDRPPTDTGPDDGAVV